MNNWDGTSWDRGYEAGRKAGLEEAHRYQHQCNADLETRYKLCQEGRELERERINEAIERLLADYAVTDGERLFVSNIISLVNGVQ